MISSADAPNDVVESAETSDEGGHPPDDEDGLHHSPTDDVFSECRVLYGTDTLLGGTVDRRCA